MNITFNFCKRALDTPENTKAYSNLTYDDCAVFYVFTIEDIKKSLRNNSIFEPITTLSNKVDSAKKDDPSIYGYKFEYFGNAKDCFDILIEYRFINKKAIVKQFKQFLSGSNMQKKIDWAGTSAEFSTFIQLLHSHVQSKTQNILTTRRIACTYFSMHGNDITPGTMANNKRPIPKERESKIKAALKCLFPERKSQKD